MLVVPNCKRPLRLLIFLLMAVAVCVPAARAQAPANVWNCSSSGYNNAKPVSSKIDGWTCGFTLTKPMDAYWRLEQQPADFGDTLPEDFSLNGSASYPGLWVPTYSQYTSTSAPRVPGSLKSPVLPNGMSRLRIVYNAHDTSWRSVFKMKVKISSILNGETTEKLSETIGATIYDQKQAIYLAVLDLPDVRIEPGAQFKLEVLPADSRSNQNEGYFIILDFRWDDAKTAATYPSNSEIANVIGNHDYQLTSDVIATSLGLNLADGQNANFGATPFYIESAQQVWLTASGARLVRQGEHTVLQVAQGGTLTVNTLDRDDHRLALQSISLMHDGTTEAFSNGSCTNPGEHHWKYVAPTAFYKSPAGPQQVTFTALRQTTVYAIGVSQPVIVTGSGGSVLDIENSNTSPLIYYNLQGLRIDNPQPGQTVLLLTPGQPVRKIQYQ